MGCHGFLQICYFCSHIVISYKYHYVYSKMILENDSPSLNLCYIRFLQNLGGFSLNLSNWEQRNVYKHMNHYFLGWSLLGYYTPLIGQALANCLEPHLNSLFYILYIYWIIVWFDQWIFYDLLTSETEYNKFF